jgi:SAM-dependent methyltransferase
MRVTKEPRIIEIGVGTGRIAIPLAERGVRVTGIDISSKMLARLREKRTDIGVMLAEASRPPLRDSTFDGALFVHILHLVPDPEATLRATLRLVRPGGVIIESRDDRRESVREEADRVINGVVLELSGIELSGWAPYTHGTALFREIMEGAGAEVTHVPLAQWSSLTRGRVMLERLARRDYSSSWQIPESLLPQVLERAAPLLDQLYGGLDREVSFERSVSMLVARLPR